MILDDEMTMLMLMMLLYDILLRTRGQTTDSFFFKKIVKNTAS